MQAQGQMNGFVDCVWSVVVPDPTEGRPIVRNAVPGGGGGGGWFEGGEIPPPPARLQGAQAMPSHCLPGGKCQL